MEALLKRSEETMMNTRQKMEKQLKNHLKYWEKIIWSLETQDYVTFQLEGQVRELYFPCITGQQPPFDSR